MCLGWSYFQVSHLASEGPFPVKTRVPFSGRDTSLLSRLHYFSGRLFLSTPTLNASYLFFTSTVL